MPYHRGTLVKYYSQLELPDLLLDQHVCLLSHPSTFKTGAAAGGIIAIPCSGIDAWSTPDMRPQIDSWSGIVGVVFAIDVDIVTVSVLVSGTRIMEVKVFLRERG